MVLKPAPESLRLGNERKYGPASHLLTRDELSLAQCISEFADCTAAESFALLNAYQFCPPGQVWHSARRRHDALSQRGGESARRSIFSHGTKAISGLHRGAGSIPTARHRREGRDHFSDRVRGAGYLGSL